MAFDGSEMAFAVDGAEVVFVSGFSSEDETATAGSLSHFLGFAATFDEMDFTSPFVDGFDGRSSEAISGFSVGTSVFADWSVDEI